MYSLSCVGLFTSIYWIVNGKSISLKKSLVSKINLRIMESIVCVSVYEACKNNSLVCIKEIDETFASSSTHPSSVHVHTVDAEMF